MSSAPEPTAVTEERAEISVATETITRYECPVCEQVVDEEELSTVTVADTETAICDYCAESVFGIDGDGEAFDAAAAIGDAADGLREKVVDPVFHLVGKAMPLLLTLWLVGEVFQEMVAEIDPAEFEAAATEVGLFTTLLEVVPLLVVLVLLIAVVSAVGPRRL